MNFTPIDLFTGFVTSLILFGIGLTLTIDDFKRIFIQPKAVVVALGFQMIALPLLAFLICFVAPIKNEFKVGLIILACSPGGSTSGFISYLLKANIALSVSLTAINSLLTLVSIPLLVSLALSVFMAESTHITLPVIPSIIQIFIVIIVPTFIGVAVRYFHESFAIRIEKIVRVLMIVLLLVVYAIKFFANPENGGANILISDYVEILPVAVIFNLVCIIFGYFFIKLFSLDHKTGITTSVETSVHNTPLAILLASSVIGDQEMVKPILIYSLFSFWTPLIFGFIANYMVRKKESTSSH